MQFINNVADVGTTYVFTLAAGTGHLQAATRVQQDLRRLYPDQKIIEQETMELIWGKFISQIGNAHFNSRLAAEDISSVNQAVFGQHVQDTVLLPWQFIRIFCALLCNDITHVVSTQSIGLKALMLAARAVNCVRHLFHIQLPPVKVSLVMTELPNTDTVNFLPFIRRLDAEDRKIFQLITTKPLVGEGQTEEEFWRDQCHLSLADHEVVYDALPIRPAFETMAAKNDPVEQLSVRIGSDSEKEQIRKCMHNAHQLVEAGNQLHVPVKQEDEVTFLMLGGQACVEATKEYVRKLIQLAKNKEAPSDHYLFVCCGRNQNNESLFNQIYHLVQEAKAKGEIPPHLNIVPLSFQTDAEIAPMIARSTRSITKSGGLISMELHALAKNKIFLHSSYHGDSTQATEEELRQKGMSTWEGGNARFLSHFHGAHIVTPQTLERALQQ